MTPADELSEDEDIRITALRYREQIPGAEIEEIEAYLNMVHTNRVHGVAIERHYASMDLPRPVSGARHTVLRTLYFAQGQRLAQNEISRELGVSRTNITNLIDGLERDGMVARVANPADRRTNYVELTPEGYAACQSVVPGVTRFMMDAFRGFSKAELAQFAEYLSRLRRDLRARYIEQVAAEANP